MPRYFAVLRVTTGASGQTRHGELMIATRFIAMCALMLSPAVAAAQELDPGAYWPIPKGLNIVTTVAGLNWGDVAFDPALPVDEATATIGTGTFVFTRAIAVAGRSANVAVVLPVMGGHLEGLYRDEFTEVDRFGLGDPRFKFAINLFGAPTMRPADFAKYRLSTIVGVSVIVMPPLGQYDPTKVINLGSNRWSFKPEVGVVRAHGRWVFEFMAGAWLFTDNTDFSEGRTREQAPILATQAHVTYRFTPAMWLAGDVNYYTGGRTTIGGQTNFDLQRNSRIGATFSRGLGGGQAIRASVSRGAFTTIGADFTSVAVGYSYAWVR